MPSLKDVVKNLHGAAEVRGGSLIEHPADPYYAPLHRRWLERKDREWTPEALEFAQRQLTGANRKPREARVSPSSIGVACERELLFGFGGAPKEPTPPSAEDVMESGEFEHLRWQMEGLSYPFLTECEVWVHSEDLRCGGSADGIGLDRSLFELKNTASHLYEAIAKGPEYLHKALAREANGVGSAAAYAAHMVRKHKLQMEAYWLVDSLSPEPKLSEWGSLVYQDRATKDVYEIRLTTDPGRRQQVHRILESVHDWIDLDELPDMLMGCQAASGISGRTPTQKERTVYERCGYREYCPTAETVTVR